MCPQLDGFRTEQSVLLFRMFEVLRVQHFGRPTSGHSLEYCSASKERVARKHRDTRHVLLSNILPKEIKMDNREQTRHQSTSQSLNTADLLYNCSSVFPSHIGQTLKVVQWNPWAGTTLANAMRPPSQTQRQACFCTTTLMRFCRSICARALIFFACLQLSHTLSGASGILLAILDLCLRNLVLHPMGFKSAKVFSLLTQNKLREGILKQQSSPSLVHTLAALASKTQKKQQKRSKMLQTMASCPFG